MVSSAARTITEYLKSLPADRRDAIARVRDVVNANLPKGYEETMQYGMISWVIPLARYPETYNGQALGIAALASQKGNMALYLMAPYGNPALDRWFRAAYKASGKKLDMGKSCVRFKTLDQLPLDVVGEVIKRVPVDAFIAQYEAMKGPPKGKAPAAAKKPAAKPAASAPRRSAARSRPRSASR